MNRLRAVFKEVKLMRFSNASGIIPDSLFPSRYSARSCMDKFPIELGKLPPKLLLEKSSISSLVQFFTDVKKSKSLAELLPRLFRQTPIHQRCCRFPRSVGTCPTKLFPERASISSREALDSETGIGPKNLLVEMDKYLRLGKVSPMLSGRVPLSRLAGVEMMLIVDIL